MNHMQHERERQKLSKAKLARKADLNESVLGQIERGFRKAYPSELGRIAVALGWPVDDAARLLEQVDQR